MSKAYYYLFYRLYRWYEKGPSVWLSEWKASFSIDVLIYSVIIFLFIYYKIFFNRYAFLSEGNVDVLLVVLPVVLANYLIFHHQDQWKKMVLEFDKMPKAVHKRWGLWLWGIVFIVIANLIFSFYLLSQIEWSEYR
jgi:hypothetical protein